MTQKFLLITAFSLMGIILISGCINEENTKEELGDEILNIGEGIPEGWNYTIITQTMGEIEIPQGLWEPVAIVDFANLNKEIGYYPDAKNNKKYHPSLQLYFYNISEKQQIIEIIAKEKMHSSCIPIYFGETGKYIIVTSPCYINSGIFTGEAKDYYYSLEKSLKEYFNKYYRLNGTYTPGTSNQTTGGMSFEESIERGLTVIEKVELSEDEKAKLSSLIENIPEEVKQEFNIKYEAWKETLDDPNLRIHSNPGMFTQSRQYEEFLSFCKEQDKTIWPLLFQKYEQGDELVGRTLVNLTYNEYGSLLDEIRQESAKERYTAEGTYIAPSGDAITMKYIKKLLALI